MTNQTTTLVAPHQTEAKFRSARAGVVASLCAVAMALVFVPSAAHANAANGACARGYKLGSYSYSKPAYNHAGQKMFNISIRKRWCYSDKKNKIGSVYAPKPSVKIYSYFGNAWSYDGIADKESRYVAHKSWKRWSHRSWYSVKMKHCALKWVGCTNHYYKVGIIAYQDGSKNRY